MVNLEVPKSFEEERRKQLKDKLEELKNKLIQFEKDNDCTIVPTLSSDMSSIRADLRIIPNDMIKKN